MSATTLSRLQSRSFYSLLSKLQQNVAKRCFAQLSNTEHINHEHVLESPFPPIAEGPYPSLYDFVTEHWEPYGGHLKDQVHIIDGTTGLQRTYSDHYKTINSLTSVFESDLMVGRHSTVAIFAPNHVEYLPSVLATALCGAQVTPINPANTHEELQHVLEQSASSVLITHISLLDTALKAVKHCSKLKHVIAITDHDSEDVSLPAGVLDFNVLRRHNDSSSLPFHHKTPKFVREHTDTVPITIPFSSGTTGLPKGVCLTHENIVSNLLQFDLVEGVHFLPGHKIISPLPFYHIYAFTVTMLSTAWKGNTLITTSGRFDFEQFCQLVEEHQPQRAYLVPPIILGLAKSPIVDKYNFSSLETIISGAAPLGLHVEQAAKERLHCKVKQAWGMTELSPIGTLNTDSNSKPGSIGQLISSTKGMIVDENGKSLGPNEVGELLIQGPQVMTGYLDDPEKTAECLTHDKWLRTGDVANYDEDGFFFITDRMKELIKVRGFPVAPAELEALLLTHESVADAAVVQRPDEKSGEVPRAYVVLKPSENDQKVTEQEIYDWVKERVSHYKRLDGGVEFVDVIPKSASGKILRRILRDKLLEELKLKGEIPSPTS